MTVDVIKANELSKAAPVFGQLSFDDHEQVVFCNDKDTGLKAIIGIHNTVLGPALGGTRMWKYNTEWEALNDALRLSRGMTFKSAAAGLNLGGGKAVIIGDAKTEKTPELMRKFGEFVHSLGGKYITAEDIGMETADMDTVRDVTPYVTGISESRGGSGNPSPITAYGVFMGMKAAAKFQFGTEHLEGKKVLVQGTGHVGGSLVEHLRDEGADIYITDLSRERMEELSSKFGAKIYEGEDIFSADVDIYAPCALGATVDDESISKLRAKVIAGAANNQLADEQRHGRMLRERGIVWAPDFLINAGGIINVYGELEGYNKQETMRQTENIFNTTLETLRRAETNGTTTLEAALKLAQDRIDARKNSAIR